RRSRTRAGGGEARTAGAPTVGGSPGEARNPRAGAVQAGAGRRIAVAAFSVAAILVLMGCSYLQVGYWRDSVALFTHAIEVTSPSSIAELNLGTAFVKTSDFRAAATHFSE